MHLLNGGKETEKIKMQLDVEVSPLASVMDLVLNLINRSRGQLSPLRDLYIIQRFIIFVLLPKTPHKIYFLSEFCHRHLD